MEELVTALGTLEPKDYVDVGAQVSGQLTRLHVDVGDTVEEGQLLAELDASVQQTKVDAGLAELESLQAQLEQRQAELELARLQYQRQERLRGADATSEDAFQSASLDADGHPGPDQGAQSPAATETGKCGRGSGEPGVRQNLCPAQRYGGEHGGPRRPDPERQPDHALR